MQPPTYFGCFSHFQESLDWEVSSFSSLPSEIFLPPLRVASFSGQLGFEEVFVFGQNLQPAASFSQCDSGSVAVLLQNLVLGNEELKVPRRVRGVSLLVVAATAGRMGESDFFRAIKHYDIGQVLEMTVIKGFGKPHRRMVLEQGVTTSLEKLELQVVVEMGNGAFVIVFLCAQLHP